MGVVGIRPGRNHNEDDDESDEGCLGLRKPPKAVTVSMASHSVNRGYNNGNPPLPPQPARLVMVSGKSGIIPAGKANQQQGKPAPPPGLALPPPTPPCTVVTTTTSTDSGNASASTAISGAGGLVGLLRPPQCSAQSSLESGPDTTTEGSNYSGRESTATTVPEEEDEEFPPLPALPPEAVEDEDEEQEKTAAELLGMTKTTRRKIFEHSF